MSNFMAESIEEIGMEPVARDTSYGRAMSVEMSLPTAKPKQRRSNASWPPGRGGDSEQTEARKR